MPSGSALQRPTNPRSHRGSMAEDLDEIVDLEAFHQELLNSVNNVRRMVVSWLPPSADLEGFKNFDDTNVNLESLRTRPERLGLGAKPSSSKTSAAALASPNSAEGRMLKTLLNGNSRKRKASEEPEAPRASTSRLPQNAQAITSRPVAQANDSEEEEDSRSQSISAKNKKKADPFHKKTAKSHQHNAAPSTGTELKKNKQQTSGNFPTAVANSKAATSDTFAKPTKPNASKTGSTSAPASPETSSVGTASKLPQSPPVFSHLSNGNPAISDDDDDESIMTETTLTGTQLESPGADANAQKKKKRKKKKKKNGTAQVSGEGNLPNASATTGMLFGNSILD